MPSKRLIKDPVKYKTVICTTWANTGQCPYNRKCQFAHGKDELRQRTALSPPQPPQPGQSQQLTPMVLPLAAAIPGGSSTAGMMPLSLTAMGPWSAAPPATTPLLPLGLPLPASSTPAQTSLLGMPPLPPGPPPTSVLPQSTLAPSAIASHGPPQAQASSLPPLPPPLHLPAMRPLGSLEVAGAPTDDVAVPRQAVAPAPSMAPPVSVYADELACFAMKCHIADDDLCQQPNALKKPDVAWEPLRCNEITGRVEIPFPVDSPVEPTLGKVGRQVSYPTQVVRRAISFVFDDGPNSPVNPRRHTAIAA
uniref:C3H1-type domain-containing protein n=2 Tax=Haptolina brevifila TaxID=156173 RepID=A0A7S2JKK9_9EUKA|mmetsp:Transcript_8370/g.16925  ORF Transcript_8370/g.16925 Transcript_8370/m.16925 type:complete len:307 (+) Transcript_8370:260-1180(+)